MPIMDDYDVFIHWYHGECNPENPNIKYAKVLNVVRERMKHNTLIGDILMQILKYGKLDNHTYKGLKYISNGGLSSYSVAKSSLKYNNGHPWLRKFQEQYGNIIDVKSDDSIVLTDKWKMILSYL